MVNIQYYDPSEIFDGEGAPDGMTGKVNSDLSISFLHSRDGDHITHNCNAESDLGVIRRCNDFGRNAGAAALYKLESKKISEFQLPELHKEYHFVSFGNKYFKRYTSIKASAYGHSEKILMRDILNDLISADPADQQTVPRPSSLSKSRVPEEQEYEVLLGLTQRANEYKNYLRDKHLIVKMWSERPACVEEANKAVCGMKCREFLEAICPEGSQFGYIVKKYKPPTNTEYREAEQAEAEKLAKEAFKAFRAAYSAYQEESSNVAHQDLSGDDDPVVSND